VSFHEDSPVFSDNSHGDDVDGADRRGGIGERCLAVGELKPEVMNVFGSRFDSPGSERVRRQSRFEPIGERLRISEALGERLRRGRRSRGHGGGSTTRIYRERESVRRERDQRLRRRPEEEERNRREKQIGKGGGDGCVTSPVVVTAVHERSVRRSLANEHDNDENAPETLNRGSYSESERGEGIITIYWFI